MVLDDEAREGWKKIYTFDFWLGSTGRFPASGPTLQ